MAECNPGTVGTVPGHVPSDPIIRELQAMLEARSAVGLAKYGTTLAGNPGDLRYWLQHALEETLDHAGYLLRAIREIEARP